MTVTAANVLAVAGASIEGGIAGETVTAGQPLYQDFADGNKLKKADNDDGVLKSVVYGIALNNASNGQPVDVLRPNSLYNPGATLTVGEIYVLSSAAGGICPEGDLGTGDYVSVIGVGRTTSQMQVNFINSGVQVP